MNLYLRKDGRYESRIPNGKKSNGKRAFLYVLARTKEQCIERVQAICQHNKPQGYCALTVSDLFNEWHRSILHRVKESTAANYAMKADKHILPAFGDSVVSSVTANHIYDFIAEKQSNGFSPRYIADIIILMKTIFKYAVRTYKIFNPMDGIVVPKKKSPEIQLLDESEQKTLQQYIGTHQNRSTLGAAIALTTGLRIGEICPLQWKDIDLEKRILTVTKTMQRIQWPTGISKTKLIITDPKSESSRRQIPIPECMMGFLHKFKGKPDEYILTGTEKPIEPRAMQYRFRTILKNAKLPSVHFHALRHIFATNCIKLGFDVKALSELLGHSSVEITLNRYVHSSFDQKREYMKRVQIEL
ncbi:MAG: site-specific integrase [Ruminococcus flavefaciens]|nr:site-specific integrase [Ruminococcus flavefaciens]